MLADLAALLEYVPPSEDGAAYAHAVIEENCLSKQTVSNRRLTYQRLRELYALAPEVPVFRVLRRLWQVDPNSRPLLAVLAGLARDPLLRATADAIVGLPDGAQFQRNATHDAVMAAVEHRLNESTAGKVVRNAASSWCQAGHLTGRTFKFRRKVRATPVAIAFAFYLAEVTGFSAEEGRGSGWVRVLDCGASAALELALLAKKLGMIDLRIAGDVIEMNLDRLDPAYGIARQRRD